MISWLAFNLLHYIKPKNNLKHILIYVMNIIYCYSQSTKKTQTRFKPWLMTIIWIETDEIAFFPCLIPLPHKINFPKSCFTFWQWTFHNVNTHKGVLQCMSRNARGAYVFFYFLFHIQKLSFMKLNENEQKQNHIQNFAFPITWCCNNKESI